MNGLLGVPDDGTGLALSTESSIEEEFDIPPQPEPVFSPTHAQRISRGLGLPSFQGASTLQRLEMVTPPQSLNR